MAYPKFHGITLANGSVIENLHIERLAADPTPVTAGRIWVNTTEKKVKFTGLDDTGAVVIHSFSSAAELTAGVADAKAYTDAQITALKGVAPELLDTLGKIAAALNNDPNVYNTLVSLMGTNIEAAKAELRGAVSGAFDTLAELEQGLAGEVAARNAAVTAEANARTAADTALDGRVSAVEGQVNGKIGDLTSLTTDAKSTIVAAVNEVDAHVDSEAARAQAAEATLTTNLAAEATRAQAAEATLTAAVAQVVSDHQAAVSAEATARAAADTAIRSDVNAGKFVFTASAAALTHTVQHNLNTSPVLVSVYTEGDDGKFRNDIVAVEETSNNTITIGLTESRKVKVAVMSMAAI